MVPTLTTTRCGCCNETFVDEVALVIVCDAVRAYRDELDARAREEAQTWRDAFSAADAAHAAVRATKAAAA